MSCQETKQTLGQQPGKGRSHASAKTDITMADCHPGCTMGQNGPPTGTPRDANYGCTGIPVAGSQDLGSLLLPHGQTPKLPTHLPSFGNGVSMAMATTFGTIKMEYLGSGGFLVGRVFIN